MPPALPDHHRPAIRPCRNSDSRQLDHKTIQSRQIRWTIQPIQHPGCIEPAAPAEPDPQGQSARSADPNRPPAQLRQPRHAGGHAGTPCSVIAAFARAL
ncbi:hypothetical protein BPORC_1720 [Bifidobacterium porcinum]|nr:hypothetical protein BPORC_1720 [Bifidobacterium porcinum]